MPNYLDTYNSRVCVIQMLEANSNVIYSAVKSGSGGFRVLTGACHASLFRLVNDDNTYDKVIQHVNKTIFDSPGVADWFDWLIRRSVWKDAFEIKDIDVIREHGFLIDLNQDWSVVGGALQLCRCTTNEFREHLKTLGALYQEEYEIDPLMLVAITLSSGLVVIQKDRSLAAASMSHLFRGNALVGTNHLPLPSQLNASQLRGLGRGEYKLSLAGCSFLSKPSMTGLSEKLEVDWDRKNPLHFNVIDCTAGEATILGQKTIVKEKEYQSLWEEGTKAFMKTIVQTSNNIGQHTLPFNMMTLETQLQ